MSPVCCAYHPSHPSTAVCSQCQAPLCSQCVEMVANQPVCRSCVGAIRARVAAQMNAPAIPISQPGYPASVPPSSGAALLLGAVYGLVAGCVGAFLLAKIEEITHIELAYFNALVGYGVGYAVLRGDQRGGVPPAVLGGLLAFFSMMLCEYFLLEAALVTYAAPQNIPVPPITSALFLDSLRHLNLIDWLCIGIGVYGGVKTPLRAQRRIY
jgi:hypothetical protein